MTGPAPTPLRGRATVEAALKDALGRGDLEAALTAAEAVDAMPRRPAPTLIGVALWYAEHGLPVFPLRPLDKKPWPGSRGCKEATTDPDKVRAWWATEPTSNIGIATGHVVDVLDFDGPEAHAAWGEKFPGTWADAGVEALGVVSTPRPGGLHVYVPPLGLSNGQALLPKVDFRGAGGYVVAPPSVLDDRDGQCPGTYRWARPLTLPEVPA